MTRHRAENERATSADKLVFERMAAECDPDPPSYLPTSTKDTFTWNASATIEHGKVSEFKFTPLPAHIPPTAYHNVFPPITSEGIQEAMKRLRELRAQWDKEDAEILASLPAREPLPPRIPDLNPDEARDEPRLAHVFPTKTDPKLLRAMFGEDWHTHPIACECEICADRY